MGSREGLVLVAILTRVVTSQPALTFQPENQLTADSYALLNLSEHRPSLDSSADHATHGLPRDTRPPWEYGSQDRDTKPTQDTGSSQASLPESLANLTVCAHVRVSYFRPSGSFVFSYATSHLMNNELSLALRPNEIYASVSNHYLRGSYNSFFPDEWYHVCVVMDTTETSLYVNGGRVGVRRVVGREVLLNGTLVLGQESDEVGGAFQPLQSFSGTVASFDLWSRSLSGGDIASLAQCSGDVPEGDVVAWSTAQWRVSGPVVRSNLSRSHYCTRENRFRFTVIPTRSSERQMRQLCHKLQSSVALPRTPEENELLFTQAEKFAGVCQPPNHARGFFWIGADNREGERWADQWDTTLSYSNFDPSGIASFPCATYLLPRYNGRWTTVSCSLYKFCGACQETRPVMIRLRGLCGAEDIHAMFRLDTDPDTKYPSFRGFTKYVIRHMDDLHWHLYDTWAGRTLATLTTTDAALPLGLHQWRIVGPGHLCGKPAGSDHSFLLSACSDDQFSCGDGSCIDQEKRCDLRVDCPNNSDEVGCNKLVLPDDYLAHLPPPGPTNSALAINMSIQVMAFTKVDIQNMALTVDFSTTVTWIDRRLAFRNLKALPEFNYIDAGAVWTPSLDLDNAFFPDVKRSTETLAALRVSPPKPDDPSLPVHDEMFDGVRTPLVLRQKVQAPFTCSMDLRMYPFDTQVCEMLIRIDSGRQNFLEWHYLEVAYKGEATMTEYVVGRVGVRHETSRNYSVAAVTFSLSRQYSYHLTSAFLPAVMLMLVGYASLFCKRENRDLRVMMSLTTLLVLYSLYQQVDDSLPSTSYTKAIDVWFFFALTFIFAQVIFHVAIDVKLTLPSKMKPSVVLAISEPASCSVARSPLLLARLFFGVIFGVFFLVFWTVVLNHSREITL